MSTHLKKFILLSILSVLTHLFGGVIFTEFEKENLSEKKKEKKIQWIA